MGNTTEPAASTDIHVLREFFGPDYEITWDWEQQVFRAVRRDDTSRVLEAGDRQEMWSKLRKDSASHPDLDG